MNDLTLTMPSIFAVCALTLVSSYILILLFRHCAHYAVWGISIAAVALICAIPIYLWYLFATETEPNASGDWLYNAIVFTFLALISVVVMIVIRDRIKLVVHLFKETAKVLLDIPALLAQPVFVSI